MRGGVAARDELSYQAAGWACVRRTAGWPPGSTAAAEPKSVWLRGLEAGWEETLRRPPARAPGSFPALAVDDEASWTRREFQRSDTPVVAWVVRVLETGTPAGQEPLEWLLVSSEGGPTAEWAERIVGWYEAR